MARAGGPVVLILVVAVAVMVTALVVTDRRVESADTGGIGRYMIAAGTYTVVAGPGAPSNEDVLSTRGGIFKIDTVTGQTWMLNERVNTGSIIAPTSERKWLPLD
ncbi:MAG TPA: hypothetical protein VMU02_06765 [bacterium]|nr:hypothetical protein [bacterium]